MSWPGGLISSLKCTKCGWLRLPPREADVMLAVLMGHACLCLAACTKGSRCDAGVLMRHACLCLAGRCMAFC